MDAVLKETMTNASVTLEQQKNTKRLRISSSLGACVQICIIKKEQKISS